MTRLKAPPTAATMAVRTALILAVFVVAFSGLLVAAFLSTREAIDAAAAAEKMKLIGEVLPPEVYDNDLLRDRLPLPPSAACLRMASV